MKCSENCFHVLVSGEAPQKLPGRAACSSSALGTKNGDCPCGTHGHVWVLSTPVHLGSLFLAGADAGTLAHRNYKMLQNGMGGDGRERRGWDGQVKPGVTSWMLEQEDPPRICHLTHTESS